MGVISLLAYPLFYYPGAELSPLGCDGKAAYGGRGGQIFPAFFVAIPDRDSGETATCCHVNQQQHLADSSEFPSGMVAKNAGFTKCSALPSAYIEHRMKMPRFVKDKIKGLYWDLIFLSLANQCIYSQQS